MKVVDYSDSETEDDDEQHGNNDTQQHSLPSLPSTFLDLYSSTVRTSTKDDPSLHSGRKRITPHIEGNWPTHVYLEWHPSASSLTALTQILCKIQNEALQYDTSASKDHMIHSLLQNDLGVALPLHISLSRPLTLRTDQKDSFLDQLQTRVTASRCTAFAVNPQSLQWHPNEDKSRYFLVLRLSRPSHDQLRRLLTVSNDLAVEYGLPQLYTALRADLPRDTHSTSNGGAGTEDAFHISIAWAHPHSSFANRLNDASSALSTDQSSSLLAMSIRFTSVKVRIGQDVTTVSLLQQRT